MRLVPFRIGAIVKGLVHDAAELVRGADVDQVVEQIRPRRVQLVLRLSPTVPLQRKPVEGRRRERVSIAMNRKAIGAQTAAGGLCAKRYVLLLPGTCRARGAPVIWRPSPDRAVQAAAADGTRPYEGGATAADTCIRPC